MNWFIEKNLRDIAKISIKSLIDNSAAAHGEEKLADSKKAPSAIGERHYIERRPLKLLDILSGEDGTMDEQETK